MDEEVKEVKDIELTPDIDENREEVSEEVQESACESGE